MYQITIINMEFKVIFHKFLKSSKFISITKAFFKFFWYFWQLIHIADFDQNLLHIEFC